MTGMCVDYREDEDEDDYEEGESGEEDSEEEQEENDSEEDENRTVGLTPQQQELLQIVSPSYALQSKTSFCSNIPFLLYFPCIAEYVTHVLPFFVPSRGVGLFLGQGPSCRQKHARKIRAVGIQHWRGKGGVREDTNDPRIGRVPGFAKHCQESSRSLRKSSEGTAQTRKAQDQSQ